MNDQKKPADDAVLRDLPQMELEGDLANAVKEIQNLQVPGASVERAVALASVEPCCERPGLPLVQRNSKGWIWAALAATIAGIVFGGLLLSQPTSLLAEMQEAVAKANTIQFVSRVYDDKDNVITEIKSSVLEPRSIRQEFGDGRVVIADISLRRGLSIDKTTKTATSFPLEGFEASAQFFDSIMSIVRGTENQQAKEVDRTKADGKVGVEYQVETGVWKARVTIDEQSKLPLKIVLPVGTEGQRIEATGFLFNQKLDPLLFALAAPDGFKLITIEKPDPIDDSDLVLTHTGIGPIEFGLSTAEVIKDFGEPDVLGHPVDEQTVDVLNYNDRGIQITVESEVGVTVIACTDDSSKFVNQGYAGQYEGGIKIGDTFEKVAEKMGEPNQGSRDDDSLVYNSKDKKSQTIFRFEDSKLTCMRVRNLPGSDK